MSLERVVVFVAFVLFTAPASAREPVAELPLQFEKNLPLASVRINGAAVLVILDSAANGCVLDASTAAAIGIKPTDSAMTSGSGGMTRVSLARGGVRLALGGLEIVPKYAVLMGLENLHFQEPVRGVLGFPLFGKHVVEIDYANRRARVFDPETFEPAPGAGALKLWMTDGPTVRGRLNLTAGEEVEADLQLDTGSSHVLSLCQPFVERHRLLEKVPGLVDGQTQGIGGGSKDKVGRILRITVGRASIEGPEVRFITQGGGTLATDRFDANLGNGFLSRHVVTFDIPHGRVFLRRPEPKASLFAADSIGAPQCFCPTFTPDGTSVVFVRADRGLFEARLEGDRWGEARPLPFSGAEDVRDGDPFLSPDGSLLFFWSSRPFPAKTTEDTDLWVVERREDGWGEPRHLAPPVNSQVNEPFPAVAADGTLYFATVGPGSGGLDLHRARPSGTGYAKPENLGPAVNSPQLDLDGYISPDQTVLVFGSDRPGGYGKIDLYVSHWKDGRWTPARNLGPAVNGPDHEFCPQLVDGGRLLLFSRDTPEGGVFRIDASVLDDPPTP
jgi:hypothetical protein